MDVTNGFVPSGARSRSRSRSRSKNRPSTSRSTSGSRRPSFASKKSLSSSSLPKVALNPGTIEVNDKDIPTVSATLDNSLPLDFFKLDILALTKALRLSKWHKKTLDIAKLKVERISGALTNSIYRVQYEDENIKIPSLLLRIYGKNVDEIIDRDLELEILIKLSAKGIGPKLLGVFANGRFEQFLDGHITLTKEQIRNEVISQMLGRRMKDLHYKVSLEYKDFKDNMPMCWKLIRKWFKIYEQDLRGNFLNNGVKDEDMFLMDYDLFKEKVFGYQDWLFGKYNTNGFAANFKFCHNDTQYGNLLLNKNFKHEDVILKDKPAGSASIKDSDGNSISSLIHSTSNKKDTDLVVIDFEYGGPNFPAFDLANHFLEWMANYHDVKKPYYLNERNFPNKIQQLNLLKAYVEYDFEFPSSNLILDKQLKMNNIKATELIEFEIKKLYNECILWRASVQIYWSIWGLIQNGPIKQKLDVDTLAGSTSLERGIDGTYTITTGLNSMELQENAIEDDDTYTDDDFDYIKYSQQKAALAVGDMISLGLLDLNQVNPGCQDMVKYLDCSFFTLT